ncbi:MAG: hypothetical protein Unbinned5079contig1000_23 [Prokaryotic dsDNA virus sp.]|nr:MAG: hypothetical protein Unbinned5079contig1000_23 [Prokaryotic dsDNA virus sp.]|tara:strand:+ start:46 stop:276 length:231 start_codon:yes stop_codon:yes gene_type:complete
MNIATLDEVLLSLESIKTKLDEGLMEMNEATLDRDEVMQVAEEVMHDLIDERINDWMNENLAELISDRIQITVDIS